MKRKTSKEELSEKEKAHRSRAIDEAVFVLLGLRSLKLMIESKTTNRAALNHVSRDLAEQIEWLVAESEVFKDAAAKLFTQEVHAKGPSRPYANVEQEPQAQHHLYENTY